MEKLSEGSFWTFLIFKLLKPILGGGTIKPNLRRVKQQLSEQVGSKEDEVHLPVAQASPKLASTSYASCHPQH